MTKVLALSVKNNNIYNLTGRIDIFQNATITTDNYNTDWGYRE